MSQTLTHLPLDSLILSKLNVRKHGPKAVESLAASIRSVGLLQPLIVRKADAAYEVVAGERRLKALARIAREDGHAAAELAKVPCILLDTKDDATAIEASLAENIERLPMDELDQYAAFAALIREGKSEDEIAEAFGITPAIVRRRLALAKLIPDIHRLYRADEIDADTLKLLTLATRERQKAYVALLRDPEQSPPPRWQLKAWLLGGAEIAVSAALFPETDYRGDIKGDLFGDERYFCDPEEFWKLQNAAIAACADDLTSKGWTEVAVIGPAESFNSFQYEPVPKASGGHAIIEVRPNGSVEVHKGLLTRGEAKKARKQTIAAEATGLKSDSIAAADGAESTTDRPELSAPLANYIDSVRLAAVRAKLLKHPKIALRLVVAQLIGGSSHIKGQADATQPASDAIAATIKALPTTAIMEDARTTVRTTLNFAKGEALIGEGWHTDRTPKIFRQLISMSDKDVASLLAVLVAETLALGSVLVDELGAHLAVTITDDWKPDDTFFELIRDKEVAGAMLSEVIGAKAAASYLTDTAKEKKDVIRKALAGDGRSKVENWCPAWLRFPQAAYTKRNLTSRPPSAA